jgi:hypothetical protein
MNSSLPVTKAVAFLAAFAALPPARQVSAVTEVFLGDKSSADNVHILGSLINWHGQGNHAAKYQHSLWFKRGRLGLPEGESKEKTLELHVCDLVFSV